MESTLLTIEEVAAYLRVSERTVYDWAQKGEIPCGRIGSSWRFRKEDIVEWVDQNIPAFSGKRKQGGVPRLAQVITVDRCLISKHSNKSDLLRALIDTFGTCKEVSSRKKFAEGIFRREALMSTGLGGGVAIPHLRDETIRESVVAFAHVRPPLTDYESIDNGPVEFVAMIGAAKGGHEEHIGILAELSRRLKEEPVRDALRQAHTSEELYAALLL